MSTRVTVRGSSVVLPPHCAVCLEPSAGHRAVVWRSMARQSRLAFRLLVPLCANHLEKAGRSARERRVARIGRRLGLGLTLFVVALDLTSEPGGAALVDRLLDSLLFGFLLLGGPVWLIARMAAPLFADAETKAARKAVRDAVWIVAVHPASDTVELEIANDRFAKMFAAANAGREQDEAVPPTEGTPPCGPEAQPSGVGQEDERRRQIVDLEKATEGFRLLATADPARFEHLLAGSLSNLAASLSDVGEGERAVVAMEEAVDIRRRLATADPTTHEPDLASCLNDLAVFQRATGDLMGAGISLNDAVAIRRRLAAANPAAFELKLARSLDNLHQVCCEDDDDLGARIAAEDAVDVYRRLAAGDPVTFEPELASRLDSLCVTLLRLSGDWEAARHAGWEAVALYRRLAAADPTAFETGLAKSLGDVSHALGLLEDWGGALAAVQEEVEICRRLTGVDSARQPDLAKTLEVLAVCLDNTGDRERALSVLQEALEVYRRLAAADPAAFGANLTAALGRLALLKRALGDLPGAVAAMREGVAIRRAIAAADAKASDALAESLDDLAVALENLGDLREAAAALEEALHHHASQMPCPDPVATDTKRALGFSRLSELRRRLGDREGAARAARAAADHFRGLAWGNGGRYFDSYLYPDLGLSLTTLFDRLNDAGDPVGALAAIGEAVQTYKELADRSPREFGPDFARCLERQSLALSGLGRLDGALKAVRRAVEVRKRLAMDDAAASELELAQAWVALGTLLRAMNRPEDEAAASREAVRWMRRRLLSTLRMLLIRRAEAESASTV